MCLWVLFPVFHHCLLLEAAEDWYFDVPEFIPLFIYLKHIYPALPPVTGMPKAVNGDKNTIYALKI